MYIPAPMRNSLVWGALTGIALLLVVVTIVGRSVVAANPAATIGMNGLAFSPATITVSVGEDVLWVNDDNNPHNVASSVEVNGVSFYSGPLEPGDTFKRNFSEPGTYPYYCTYHPSMSGEIVVIDGPAPTPAPTATPTVPAPPPAGGTQVLVFDNGYNPAGVTVAPGTQVRWTNTGGAPHTVTSSAAVNGVSFHSGTIVEDPDGGGPAEGGVFVFTFTEAGTYEYYCTFHGGMTGTVVVGGGGPPPPPTPTPVPGATATPTSGAPTPTSVPPTATPVPGTPTPPPAGTNHTVDVGDNWFGSSSQSGTSPLVTNISAGDTITWNWAAGIGDHNVRGTNSAFSANEANGPFVTSAPIQGGPSTYGPLTFTTAGTYFYRCSLHPTEMRGQVNVSGPTPPPGVTPTPVPPTPTPTLPVPASTPTPTPAGAPGGPTTRTVEVGDDWFGSSANTGGTVHVLTIAAGDAVTWNWGPGVGDHNVRGTDSGFSTNVANGPFVTNAPIQAGASTYGPLTFTSPGTYYYRCSLHPANMRGQINVSGAGSPPPPGATATPTPTPTPTMAPPPPPPPGALVVGVEDNFFSPLSPSIVTGTRVRWQWAGVTPHTVTSRAAGLFNSGILEQGSMFEFVFGTPGTYDYYCTLHTGMEGTITVTGAAVTPVPGASPTPVAGPTATPTTPPPPPPGAFEVQAYDNGFEPSVLTVPAGSTIAWRNTGALPHTVTDAGGAFNSGIFFAPGIYTRTFTGGGTYTYTCILHPEMVGTITVIGDLPGSGSGSPTPPPPTVTTPSAPAPGGVSMVDNDFSPATLTVRAGATVTWTNTGRIPHTATAADGAFDSGIKMPGQAFTASFPVPGTFPYTCILHPGMVGRVIVTDAAGAAPAPRETVDAKVPATPEPTVQPAGKGVILAELIDNDFKPRTLTVRTGSTVRWVNAGQIPHTVTDRGGSFDSGILPRGRTFAYEFTRAGTYQLVCVLHPQMTAEVVVSESAPASTGGDSDLRPSAETPGDPIDIPAALQNVDPSGMSLAAKVAIWVVLAGSVLGALGAVAAAIRGDIRREALAGRGDRL